MASFARAATVTATWNGGAGSWTEPANWSGVVIPRNTAADSYHAQIDGGNATASTVTLESEETIATLEISAGDQLFVTSTARLTLEGSSLVNHGDVVLEGSGATSARSLVAGELSGGGSIRLEGGALVGTDSLTNLDNLISGWGSINGGIGYPAGFENNGVVEANVGGKSLLQVGSGLNYGTMRAVDGGTLYLKADGGGPNFANYGVIEALDGSSVFSGDGFHSRAGTITALRNSTMVLAGSHGNTEFVADATSTISFPNTYLGDATLRGRILMSGTGISGTVINEGSIHGSMRSFGSATVVNHGEIVLEYEENIDPDSVLSFTGGGFVTLAGFPPPTFPGDFYGPIRNVDNQMSGIGSFTRLRQNGGLIEADGGTLVVRRSAVDHTGLFAAAPGGVLEMEADVTGSGAWLADGGTIHVTGDVATTGDVDVRNGGSLVVDSQMSLGDLAVDSTGSLDVEGILRVAGDVDIAGANETRFAFGPGSSLEIVGPGGAALGDWASWQFMEATGIDLFLQPLNGGGMGLYLPKLVIGPDGRLVFRDLRDNGNKPFPEFSGEEVWVGTLEFADSLGLVNKNGITLHYSQLVGSPDQIIDVPVPEPELAWLVAAALGCALGARRWAAHELRKSEPYLPKS